MTDQILKLFIIRHTNLKRTESYPISLSTDADVKELRHQVAGREHESPHNLLLYGLFNGVKVRYKQVLITDGWPCKKFGLRDESVVLSYLKPDKRVAELPDFGRSLQTQLLYVTLT